MRDAGNANKTRANISKTPLFPEVVGNDIICNENGRIRLETKSCIIAALLEPTGQKPVIKAGTNVQCKLIVLYIVKVCKVVLPELDEVINVGKGGAPFSETGMKPYTLAAETLKRLNSTPTHLHAQI